MWTDRWVGLPFRHGGRGPEAFDCLGLFLALMRERLGLVLPDPQVPLATDTHAPELAGLVDCGRIAAEPYREGDAALFRAADGLHVGFILNDRDMLHMEYGQIGSCIAPWRHGKWSGRLIEVYRAG